MAKNKFYTAFKSSISSVVWTLKLYWKISPGYTALSISTTVLDQIISVINTYIFAKAIDILISISQGNLGIEWAYYVAAFFFVFSLTQTGLNLLGNYSQRILSPMFYPKYQELMYKKLISMNIGTLEDPETNNLIERARRESGKIERVFFDAINLFGVFTAIVTSGIVLFTFAPQFIPIFIVTIIPSIFIDRKFLSKLWTYNRDITEKRRNAYDSAYNLQESRSLHELKITGGHKYLSNQFESYIKNYIIGLKKLRKNWNVASFGTRAIRAIAEAYANIYIFLKFIQNSISIGNVTFYARQTGNFLSNLNQAANSINNIYESSLTISEIQELFNIENEKDGDIKLDKLEKGPDIEFNSVDFIYPGTDKRVIENLSLTIKSGEKIAIVGQNGAGKTTMIKLLLRFYKPAKGHIKVNNNDLTDLKINDYYKNISVLFQEFNTYENLTVKENIIIGKIFKKFKKSEMQKAAKNADVDEFVSDYTDGYNQVLSEKYKGGIRPSWGQWQKIAIARFFYRNAPLVIFDEPTAAIDAVSEAKIFNKIYNFFKHKTVIIISHRFSTVRNADRILVFAKGRVVEDGSHEELLKLDGIYAKSFNLQAKGYK